MERQRHHIRKPLWPEGSSFANEGIEVARLPRAEQNELRGDDHLPERSSGDYQAITNTSGLQDNWGQYH